MITKNELHERLLWFNPTVLFDGAVGGIKLLMEIDAFNGHINWCVEEGDHITDFINFNDAVDYYLKVTGGK